MRWTEAFTLNTTDLIWCNILFLMMIIVTQVGKKTLLSFIIMSVRLFVTVD